MLGFYCWSTPGSLSIHDVVWCCMICPLRCLQLLMSDPTWITGSCYGKLKCGLINTSKANQPFLTKKEKGHLKKCIMGLKESSLQDCAHLKWGDVPVALLHGAKVVSEVPWAGRKAVTPVSAVDMVMVEPSLWIANTGFVLNICNELCDKLKFFITSSTILILILIFN